MDYVVQGYTHKEIGVALGWEMWRRGMGGELSWEHRREWGETNAENVAT